MASHSEYLDGNLSPVAAAQLSAHADVCADCARYDRIVRKGIDLVRDLPDVEPSSEFEMRLQHRIFHMEDAAALQPRATSAATALGVAAAIALLAWSPLLLMSGDREAGAVGFEQAAENAFVVFDTSPMFSPSSWYPTTMPAPAHQPSAMFAMFPGPYSPLVVTPPAHRSVRRASAEYAPVD
jgi:anti-sigma factor RsiW